MMFRRPLCCTRRRRTEKNKRKVGREAGLEKLRAAHLGVHGRPSGGQMKKKREEQESW